ncbi:MAG: InlB B-repeat-containing protein, partial [Paludibacteraceae bacterium]|nr:InlB B-repeat-containing protein [Paludibacteraceae bacterium]
MKNFTQLLPGRDGSNAKTNNTSGHAYAFTLILTLLLTLGVGQMWGAVYILGPDGSWTEDAAHTMNSAGISNWVYQSLTPSAEWNGFKVKNGSTWKGKDVNSNCVVGTSYHTGSGENMYCDFSQYNEMPYYFFYNTSTAYLMIQPNYYLAGTCGASDQSWAADKNTNTYDATNGYFKWNTCSLTANTEYSFKLTNGQGTAWTYEYGDRSGVTVTQGTKTSNNAGNIVFRSTYGGTAVIVFMPTDNTMVIHCPYQISYNKGSNGSGTISSGTKTWNTSFTLSSSTFTRAGYTQDGWSTSDGGAKVYELGGSYTTDADLTLYPHWTENMSSVSLVASPSGKGSFTVGGAAATSTTAGVTTTKAVTAVPISGYHFVSWSITGGASISSTSTNPTTVTGGGAGTAATLTATFAADDSYTLTVAAGTGISAVTGTTSNISAAQNIAITATVATGYTWSTWTKTGAGTLSTFTAGTKNQTVTVGTAGDITLTASATERMSTLSTSNHYDAGNPSYAAPTVSGSATNVGYVTTRTITAAAASTGYTFTGWTLTNCTRTDGGGATANPITIRSNGDGAAATVVANYEEVLTQSTWVIKGGTAISGSDWATEVAMSKASGASTSDIVYATINISATNTGDSNGAYKFKVVKKSPDTYFGLDASGQYYLMREESGIEKTLDTDNSDIELRADVTGDYVFKVDYSTPASPKLTVTWPTAVYLSADDESAYADGSVTLTAEGANLTSDSKTIEYEFFKGDNTLPANKIGTTQTFNSITATSHSTTQSVSPEFSTSDYSASQIYTVKMTINGSTSYTNTITIYRKWDIYVHDVVGWGGLRLYMWGGTTGDNGGWPGTACEVLSGNWYTVTLSSKYYSGFLLNKSSDENIKTNDHHTSAAAAGDKNDHDELCSYFEEGSYYYIHSYEWESKTYYELNPVDMSAPTVEMQTGESQSLAINTTELFLTGLVTGYGGDGLSARDMAECGFIINGVEYPVSSFCTAEDSGFFWGYVGGLTPGTTYTVSAYAKNIMGRGVSENTASVATRAAGTNTIKVRTGVSDPVPHIYAWTWNEVCDHSTLQNAAWPGAAMTLSITGTTYKWYTYELSNEYNEFKISESGSNETNNFNNPFESTCYWYHSSEATKGDRMGSMTCPYVTPQLMIEENAGEEDFTYLEMSTSPTISKTVSLAAKSTYLFKIVYNAEWYGKASVNLSRAENTVSGISAAIEDNMAITTDAAGDYTFTFSTPGTVTVTYPTAYTVTFGYGTGGTAVTASATTAGGALTSGDYVAAGDEVTFTQTPATGYTFKGWYTTADGNTTVTTMGVSDNELNDIAANATVYAQYTPNNYTVTFDAATNGGACGTPSKSVTFDAAYGDLPEATKGAKVFAGWYTTASGEGTQVTAETIVSNAANHTIYARFEDTYSVTIQYKSGDVTLKPNGSTTASATALSPEVTAPEFLGYTFTGWTGTSATFANASSATTTVNVTAATTITANYSAIPTVYFKNNLGWEHVYVTFDNTWSSDAPCNNGKPYYEMTQMGESDIFYCVIPGDVVSSWAWNIAFDNHGFSASENVGTFSGGFNTGEFIGRGDFASEATMFIPYNGDKEGRNGGTYYRTGCWMKYNSTDPGYKVYANTYKEGSGGVAVAGTPVLLTADIAGGYEFKATVNFPSANYTYGFMLKKEATSNTNDLWYTNTSDIYASTTTLPWDFTAAGASENGTRCGLHTEATGNYEITVSFATGKPMVNVTYPVSTNDWRLVYKDRATWSNGAHTAAWQHSSRVIKAKADAEDIVSFYVSKADGANATIELQKCTDIDPGTGAQTWVKQSDVDLSAITSTGIYNFKVTQNGSMEATVAFDGGYVGNFYIRTDASDGGWSNYKTSGTNTMTYSEYSLEHGGEFGPYSHYFMRYVTAGSNIKFCIANDYSECISDTIVGDTYTGEYIAASGNVRFMWYWETNKIGRAYISGSSIISDRFLVLEGDAKMFNEAGTALT